MELILLFLIGLLSAFLQSAIGFGAAIMMVNILPLFIEPGSAVAVTQVTCIIFPLYILVRKWRNVRMDVLLPLLVPSLICTVIATRISIGFDTSIMKILLGALFVLLSLYFMFLSEKISVKPTKLNGAVMGAVSGVLGGMFVAGGPPAVLYLAPALEEKDEYVATIQVYFLALNLLSFLTRVLSSAVNTLDMKRATIATAGAIIGAFIALRCTKNMKGTLLRRFIYTFVGINGVVMIFNEKFFLASS